MLDMLYDISDSLDQSYLKKESEERPCLTPEGYTLTIEFKYSLTMSEELKSKVLKLAKSQLAKRYEWIDATQLKSMEISEIL